jgi:hypothetical protein
MGSQDSGINGLGQAQTAEEGLKWKFYDLNFSVSRSRRYHEKLCAFYGGWRDAVKIVTVIAGSGLFLLVLAEHKLAAELLAGFVALWAMIDYLVGPDKKPRNTAIFASDSFNWL